MTKNNYTMLDHLLDPPCKEPDPERLCHPCNRYMEWQPEDNQFWCPLCNDVISWDEIQHNRYEGTYDN